MMTKMDFVQLRIKTRIRIVCQICILPGTKLMLQQRKLEIWTNQNQMLLLQLQCCGILLELINFTKFVSKLQKKMDMGLHIFVARQN